MNKVKSPKLLQLYAKAKMQENKFKEAEEAFEKAEDWESVVELNLNQLDDIEKAKFVLRNKCQTAKIAAMVAATCDKRGSKGEAVEFLIMAGKKEEAFTLS
jgi:WD repeat-containing protein 19